MEERWVDGGNKVTFTSLVSVVSARARFTRAASRNTANVGCVPGESEGWPGGWEDADTTTRAESGLVLDTRGTETTLTDE